MQKSRRQRPPIWSWLPLAVGLVAGIVTMRPADSAAPWFMLFEGSLLSQPVQIDRYEANETILQALSWNSTVVEHPEGLESRPYLDVALFWGPDWYDVAADSGRIERSRANQYGRFYPELADGRPALFLLEINEIDVVREASTDLLIELETHGVPTRISLSSPEARAVSAYHVGSALLLASLGLVGVLAWTRLRTVPD